MKRTIKITDLPTEQRLRLEIRLEKNLVKNTPTHKRLKRVNFTSVFSKENYEHWITQQLN